MISLVLLKSDDHEIIQEKFFNKKINVEYESRYLIDMISDIESFMINDYLSMNIENKTIVYRRSKESKLAIILQAESDKFKTNSLIILSSSMLGILEKKYFSDTLTKQTVIENNFNEIFFSSVEDLTIDFLDHLKKHKLFTKFIYFNYNPGVNSHFTYKKTKRENSSLMFNKKDRSNYGESTLSNFNINTHTGQRSTIKEKELFLPLNKEKFSPNVKRIFAKNFIMKEDKLDYKNLYKCYSSSFFIDKFVS